MKKLLIAILISIIILIILLTQFVNITTMIRTARHKKISKEILDDIVIEMKRDYNLIVDKEKYEVNAVGVLPGSVLVSEYYFGIRRKGRVEYKSKYFKEYEETYYVLISEEGGLGDDIGYRYTQDLFTMLNFGLRPYVLNNLLYDKAKGNDFEQIEKLLDKYYTENKIRYYYDGGWACDIIEDDIGGGGGLNFVKDEKCNEEILDETGKYIWIGIKKYMERYKEYFSVERELEKIDWEEYMKFNEIYPLLQFEIEGISEEELKELRKKIKPYFNDKILYIQLVGTVKLTE